jgi:hypothetical protein
MKVIVLQTSFHAVRWCQEVLPTLGLGDGEFAVEHDSDWIEQHIVPNTRQLFITGSFSGSTDGLPEFIENLRKKNSKLIVASYSVNGVLSGTFDLHIQKNRDDDAFQDTVLDFVSGKLQQNPDLFWNPSNELLKKVQSGKIPRKFVVVSSDTKTLKMIKETLVRVDPKRAEEIFFTQSPHQAVSFVGKSTTAVIITTDLFRNEFDKNMHPWGGPNLATILSDIKWPRGWGFSNLVLRYGWNPEPHQSLQAIIKRPHSERESSENHALLAEIITTFPRKFSGKGVGGLLEELDGHMVKKFPAIDRSSCLNLRPATF